MGALFAFGSTNLPISHADNEHLQGSEKWDPRGSHKVDSGVSCPHSRNTRQPPCMQTKLSITFSLERSSNESDSLESDLAHVALFIVCHLCHYARGFPLPSGVAD